MKLSSSDKSIGVNKTGVKRRFSFTKNYKITIIYDVILRQHHFSYLFIILYTDVLKMEQIRLSLIVELRKPKKRPQEKVSLFAQILQYVVLGCFLRNNPLDCLT